MARGAWVVVLSQLACAPAGTTTPTVNLQTPVPTQPTPVATGDMCARSRLACSSHGCFFVSDGDHTEPLERQSTACAKGGADACVAYGARLALGEDVARDVEGATRAFSSACTAGSSLGCVDHMKITHRPFEELARSCDARVGEACLEAGNDIGWGAAAATHTPADRARYFQRACDLGIAVGCTRLAFHYGTGLAVTRDDRHSFQLYEKACRCHDDTGCSGVGVLVRDGAGVPQDYARAMTIFAELCARKVAASCTHLGEMYQYGQGVAVDLARARELYEGSCADRARNPEGGQGCVALGELFRDGRGVTVDDHRAFELFDQACHGKVPAGCGNLGLFYRDGRAVARDVMRAQTLLDYACNHGDAEACKNAKALSSSP
jgi:TPR repeat protein